MKKTISILLVCVLMFSVLSVSTITTFAASKKLADINDFKQSLTNDQYNALRNGSITAEKRGNTWYYKFSTKSYYVFVKASAFSGAVNNNYNN